MVEGKQESPWLLDKGRREPTGLVVFTLRTIKPTMEGWTGTGGKGAAIVQIEVPHTLALTDDSLRRQCIYPGANRPSCFLEPDVAVTVQQCECFTVRASCTVKHTTMHWSSLCLVSDGDLLLPPSLSGTHLQNVSHHYLHYLQHCAPLRSGIY